VGKQFVLWFEDYLEDYGIAGIVTTVVSLIALGSALSAILGVEAIRGVAAWVVIVVVVALFALVSIGLRTSKKDSQSAQDLIGRYCDLVSSLKKQSNIALWEVVNWTQREEIGPNGDSVVTCDVKGRAIGSVEFVRLVQSSENDCPERYRRKLKIEVRSVDVNSVGPKYRTTHSWPSVREVEVLVHFHEPVEASAEFNVRMTFSWPRKSRELMKGTSSEAFWFAGHRAMGHLEHKIVLKTGQQVVKSLIGDITDAEIQYQDGDGVQEYKIIRTSPATAQRSGIRLEIRKRR